MSLDNVRIKGALGEVLDITDLSRFFLKDANEEPPNDLPFALRIFNPFQGGEKQLFRINIFEINVESVLEGVEDLLRLIFSQDPVVHKYATKVVSNGLMHERCYYR